jgi:hypothetical protein
MSDIVSLGYVKLPHGFLRIFAGVHVQVLVDASMG